MPDHALTAPCWHRGPRMWQANLPSPSFRHWSSEGSAMTCTHFAEGEVLFREGDPPDCVFRLLSGAVEILRELDGEPILLGTVGAGQFIGEMGVVENRPRSATARAASEVEVEIFTPTEFFDQI